MSTPMTRPPAGGRLRRRFGPQRHETMAGALQTLGMHVPQPEVVADETNPKGVRRAAAGGRVPRGASSAATCRSPTPAPWRGPRPQARTSGHCGSDCTSGRSRSSPKGPSLVKYPRLAWFVGVAFRGAALRRHPSYVTHAPVVTEVVGSKQRHYTTKFGEVQRTAAWVNMMLHTERATAARSARSSATPTCSATGPSPCTGRPRVRHRRDRGRHRQRGPGGARLHRPELHRARSPGTTSRYRRGSATSPRRPGSTSTSSPTRAATP